MIHIDERPGYIAIVGHAGEPPDLICEDITALVQTLLLSISQMTEDKIDHALGKGACIISHEEDLSERARLLIESFFIGACAVADSFPEKVRVTRQASH